MPQPQPKYPYPDKGPYEPEPIRFERSLQRPSKDDVAGFESLRRKLEELWLNETESIRSELRPPHRRFTDWLIALVEGLAEALSSGVTSPGMVATKIGLPSLARILQHITKGEEIALLTRLAIAWLWTRGYTGESKPESLEYVRKKLVYQNTKSVKALLAAAEPARETLDKTTAHRDLWGFCTPPEVVLLHAPADAEMAQALAGALALQEPELICVPEPIDAHRTLEALERRKRGDILFVLWSEEARASANGDGFAAKLLEIARRHYLFLFVGRVPDCPLPTFLLPPCVREVIDLVLPIELTVDKILRRWRADRRAEREGGAPVLPAPFPVDEEPNGVEIYIRSNQAAFGFPIKVDFNKPCGPLIEIVAARPEVREALERQTSPEGWSLGFKLFYEGQPLDNRRSLRVQGVAAGDVVSFGIIQISTKRESEQVDGHQLHGDDLTPAERQSAMARAWKELHQALMAIGLRFSEEDEDEPDL